MNSSSRQYAVVTGASSGIGLELAKEFARNGYDVLAAAEDDALESAADEIRALGTSVETCRVDLATPEGVQTLAGRIQSSWRPVDILALNAGIGVGGPFLETPLEQELRLIDLNVRSTVHLAKLTLPAMVQRGKGRVLITSSIAAVAATPYEAVYGASKAFDKSFAASLRNELKDAGITVTTLMPGPTETNFFHRAGMDDTQIGASEKKADPAQVAQQAYDALMAGKHEVVAGPFSTKFEGTISKAMPEELTAAKHAKMAEPGGALKS
ncbi:MAG TPA: SDR family NAD(P)-dependent oxidoreductase [Candidatus Elarobacter sp.]|jgi:short-subunit dehydrogenase|nr:SDR family NAD(P)-dependent oxidoreductase [Candidatus Elarobacter sp.]